MVSKNEETAVVYADVPLKLKADLYRAAIERKGNRRGIISDSVKEALELWIKVGGK